MRSAISAFCAIFLTLLATSAVAEEASVATVVLPTPPGTTNHAPGLIELPGGEILACWYSGASEANADARILCSRSGDRGDDWSAPAVAVDQGEQATGARAPNKSLGNVTLSLDAGGRLWLIYGVIQRWDWPLIGNVCRNWLCGRIDAKVSVDRGENWSPGWRLDDQIGALPRAKPLHIDGLGDVLPLYREGDATAYLRILDLASWTDRGGAAGHIIELPGEGLIQPALLVQPDGKVRAFLRDSRGVAVYTALFDPASGQWTPPRPTDLPNPGAAVDAFLDDQGRFVVVYNPSRDDRRTLALAWSEDGSHFHRGCNLVERGVQGDVAYPVVIRAGDGSWHVVYSSDGKSRIRHIAFNAAWLRQCLVTD